MPEHEPIRPLPGGCSMSVTLGVPRAGPAGADDPFTTKLGGRPVWLEPTVASQVPPEGEMLPRRFRRRCEACGNPLFLVIQCYAPAVELPHAVFRSLYVAGCNHAKCKAPTWICLREQWPDTSAAKVEESAASESAAPAAATTAVWGDAADDDGWGESEDDFDWNTPTPAPAAPAAASSTPVAAAAVRPPLLDDGDEEDKSDNAWGQLPAVALEEMEEPAVAVPDRTALRGAELADHWQGAGSDDAGRGGGGEAGATWEGEEYEALQGEGKALWSFQKRFAREPSQLLRYSFQGTPLWMGTQRPPRVPPCPCGTPRVFELQVMAGALHLLHVDRADPDPPLEDAQAGGGGMDWSTLAVYTCPNSCPVQGSSFAKEFVFVAPPV